MALIVALLLAVAAPAAAQSVCLLSVCIGGGSDQSPGPSGPVARPPVHIGFNDFTYQGGVAPRQVAVDLLADTGAGVHRWALSWGGWEPQPGQVDQRYIDLVDSLYQRDLERGVRPMIQLFGSPKWAVDPMARTPNGEPPCQSGPRCLAPPNMRNYQIRDQWKAWVAGIARRYRQAVAIEVWNEPNLMWAWEIRQDPELYGRLLKSTTAAVRSTGVGIPVLVGGLSSTTATVNRMQTRMETFIKQVYQYAGIGNFDGIGYHSYPCNPENPTYNPQRDLERVRRMKTEAGDPHRPVWLTESGSSTVPMTNYNCPGAPTEAAQGEIMAAVIDWARRTQADSGDLRSVVVNSLFNHLPRTSLDQPNPDGSDELGFVAWSGTEDTGDFQWRWKAGYPELRCTIRLTC